MLTASGIVDYCLKKEGATIEFPFGDNPVCIKAFGLIVAEIYPEHEKITLRCDPVLAEFLRMEYPGIVVPGYHAPLIQKKFKNTIFFNKGITEEEVLKMIDHAYEEVKKKNRKKFENY
jgi:predicted DNA-binding protein (MmcQ/YjbR family)